MPNSSFLTKYLQTSLFFSPLLSTSVLGCHRGRLTINSTTSPSYKLIRMLFVCFTKVYKAMIIEKQISTLRIFHSNICLLAVVSLYNWNLPLCFLKIHVALSRCQPTYNCWKGYDTWSTKFKFTVLKRGNSLFAELSWSLSIIIDKQIWKRQSARNIVRCGEKFTRGTALERLFDIRRHFMVVVRFFFTLLEVPHHSTDSWYLMFLFFFFNMRELKSI